MKITSKSDRATLNNGVKMDWLGLGVFQSSEGGEVENSIKWALEAGYRSIDTASVYGNERGVGEAIRESSVPREEIFLTTKVWNDAIRAGKTKQAFEESLQRLGIDYVDLYLMHWPVKSHFKKAWKEMEQIYHSGKAKAIGVSNFMIHHLHQLFDVCEITPAVNQVEFHPYLVQPDLLKFCQKKKIQLEAWSPLMKGRIDSVPEIENLAQKYKRTPAQIVLSWDLQHEVVTIPKSARKDRIIENIQVFDFELLESDMAVLDGLDRGQRFGPDPYDFSF